MDLSALISGLITENTVKEVSKKSGASKKDVSSVLTTALPLLLSNNNTTAQQVSEQSGVSQNTTSNVLTAAAPLLLGSLGQGQSSQQSSTATNVALLGALLGKVDLGKLTSGLMGLVSTNTATSAKEEEKPASTTSGKKKTGAKKTDGKKTEAKKTDSKKKTGTTTGKKTSSSKKKTEEKTEAKKESSPLDAVTGLLSGLLKNK